MNTIDVLGWWGYASHEKMQGQQSSEGWKVMGALAEGELDRSVSEPLLLECPLCFHTFIPESSPQFYPSLNYPLLF